MMPGARGLLLAGGAAAMGFLAKTMYDDYKEYQAAEECMQERQVFSNRSSGSSGPQPSSPSGGNAQFKDDWKEKNDDVSEATRCIVCMDTVREVIIEPCGHVCICKNCARKIVRHGGKCPVCKRAIMDIKSCYLP